MVLGLQLLALTCTLLVIGLLITIISLPNPYFHCDLTLLSAWHSSLYNIDTPQGVLNFIFKKLFCSLTRIRNLSSGGRDKSSRHKSCEMFSHETNTWTEIAEMNHGRAGAAVATLHDK